MHLFFENWKLYPRAQERTKDDKMLTFVVPKNCFANPAKNKNCQAVHTSWREQGSSLEPFFWKSTSHAAKMRGTRSAKTGKSKQIQDGKLMTGGMKTGCADKSGGTPLSQCARMIFQAMPDAGNKFAPQRAEVFPSDCFWRRAVQQMYFIVKLFSGKRGVGDKHPLAKFVASSVFNFQSVLDIPFFKARGHGKPKRGR